MTYDPNAAMDRITAAYIEELLAAHAQGLAEGSVVTQESLDHARAAGFEAGHLRGMEVGDAAGYSRGYDVGYEAGYTDGTAAVDPGETIRQASTAVRVFPSYTTRTYGHHAAVLDLLGDLGVKRMSHKMGPAIANANDPTIKFTRDAYERFGIKSWLTIGDPREPLTATEWARIHDVITGPLAGMVELVSGWNEPNHVRGGGTLPADWPAMTVEHNRQLYSRFGGSGIRVGTPQLWSGDFARHEADVKKLAAAGLKGTFDTIAWHLYPRGTVGTSLLQSFETLYRAQWGPQPIVCTEGGYLDAANYTGGAANHTPQEKAVLVPQWVDSYVSRGYACSYFELLDDPDATESDREASLGLVECKGMDPSTWVKKPSFHSLKEYLAART